MAGQKKVEIENGKRALICVEGKDEVNFIGSFLATYGNNAEKDGYQIIEVGGRNNFASLFPTIKDDDNIGGIKLLLIVRDAETEYEETVQSMEGVVDKSELRTPDRAVDYYIMPGGGRNGMLEDLCLDWYASDRPHAKACLDDYEVALRGCPDLPQKPNNLSKARALMMLATSYDSANSLGVAAIQGFFSFESKFWEGLHGFFVQHGFK